MTLLDKSILNDLWKWKFLTTAAVVELHFPGKSPSYAHRRLLRLKEARLVRWLFLGGDHGRDFAWALTKKGFDAILPLPFPLKEVGFRSESIEHDRITSAIHLGEWLFGMPKGCKVFTEQELRRYHPSHYPEWVPNTEVRRPDGYWRTIVDGELETVALEVELSYKLHSEYTAMAQFYSIRQELLRVVWLVKYRGMAKEILEAAHEIKGPGMRLHEFILLSDFLKTGWNTKFFAGRDAGMALSKLFPVASEIARRHVASMLLLNGQKSPHRSPDYTALKNSFKSHRVGSYLLAPLPTTTSSNKPNTGDPTNET